MRTTLTDDRYRHELTSFRRTAFRLETKPAYTVVGERTMYAKFLAGQPPTIDLDDRYYADGMAAIARRTEAGATRSRVRITDSPLTEYQRFLQWSDRLNLAAGERIEYLPRGEALLVGLPVQAADPDWWLLDDERLITITHDTTGRRTNAELTTDSTDVHHARLMRDLAIRTARKATR